tara:strand:- start:2642 stop:3157 length:516 start_codon:yes stop_codon:yes gene_type:complete
MMKLRISGDLVAAWQKDLIKAGKREIGGVLFGEQIAEGDFRLVEATRQRFGGGTRDRFHRRGRPARKAIEVLHNIHGGDAERFNYLGEWHSHPSAPALPSIRDQVTMFQLLADQAGAVNFLVLLIVRVNGARALEMGAAAYLASGHRIGCQIVIEAGVSIPINIQDSGETP